MKKINVSLYGGKQLFAKGREEPLIAEIISCDKCENCSLYKQGYCMKITSMNSGVCKFGHKERIKGYTSRAKKYYDFYNKYKNDEKYCALKSPNNCRVFLTNDWVYINIPYAGIKKDENGFYNVDRLYWSSDCWIEISKLTINLLYELCSYKPEAVFGGVITDYQNKYIPEFLLQLRKEIPKLYNEFVKEHPEFNIKPNYVGKKAYVNTLAKGCKIIENECEFIYDGEYLTCDNYTEMCFAPFNADSIELKIKATNDMKCTITDNSQVNENTKFEV